MVLENRPGAATAVANTAAAQRGRMVHAAEGTSTLAINPACSPALTPRDRRRI